MDRPTREIIAQHLDYDPATGVLRWKIKRQGVRLGSIAGTISKTLKGIATGAWICSGSVTRLRI